MARAGALWPVGSGLRGLGVADGQLEPAVVWILVRRLRSGGLGMLGNGGVCGWPVGLGGVFGYWGSEGFEWR